MANPACAPTNALRAAPAMTAVGRDKLWEMSDLVAIVEAAEKAPGKRGLYKARKESSV